MKLGALNDKIVRTMTLSTQATPFGCCNFFDDCADGLFSLYYRGQLDLLDLMNFGPTIDCYRSVEFISYVRPEQSGGTDTPGYLGDPCEEPHGVEFGSCKLTVEDFGLIARKGPVRNMFKPERYCKTSPRYFFDGTPVTNEAQWDAFFAMDQLLNDVRILLITGNSSTAGQFDGLQRWVKTGYECSGLDSYIVDWNGNNMSGTGGGAISINGVAVPGTPEITDALLELNQNINIRIGWSPLLKQQKQSGLQKVIILPSFMKRCLLDSYTCWSVCPGAQYEEIVKNLKDIREFRSTLNGGMFGQGKIYLDDEEISLLAYDWGMINGNNIGDMYMLTTAVGSQRLWDGEHLNANIVLDSLSDQGLADRAGDYIPIDGGRVLMKSDFENLCAQKKVWMSLRLFCMAPWAQIRFQDVVCTTLTGPLSPDPGSGYFPTSYFSPAICP